MLLFIIICYYYLFICYYLFFYLFVIIIYLFICYYLLLLFICFKIECQRRLFILKQLKYLNFQKENKNVMFPTVLGWKVIGAGCRQWQTEP